MTKHAHAKIQPHHLDRLAVVYVRQSHPQQRVKHPESVPCQRRLQQRIRDWGWAPDRIHVLEDDIGKSGTTTVGRDAFLWILSEIKLGHVGLLAGFQMNRLAREDEAICQLINSCIMRDTLVADQDGVYDPQDINDRLLLNIKGLVGSVELYHIQQRMQHGRLERARRGEWQGPSPMGYLLGEDGKLTLDPDEQVRHAVQQLFPRFEHLGSISAVLRDFHQRQILLPVRVATGLPGGRLEWRRAHRATIRSVLRHPAYAGAFTWGRRPTDPRRALPGQRGTGRIEVALKQCAVFLPDNHAAYIDWERYQRNLQRIGQNRRRGPQPSGRREVVSLLAGLAFCGRCGARLQTHYSPRLRYTCARHALDHGEKACCSLPGEELERLLAEQILVALEPASLELSLAGGERLEAERAAADREWRLRLERAQHQATRAQRQYDHVEPENRLVARTLERAWEEALCAQRGLQEEYDRFRATRAQTLSATERAKIEALAGNAPQLWARASVADKRRVVQLLLGKAVVTNSADESLQVALHGAGGMVTQHLVRRRVYRWSSLSQYEAILTELQKQVAAGRSSEEIAAGLNQCGYRTCRGEEFTAANVRQLRSWARASQTRREKTRSDTRSRKTRSGTTKKHHRAAPVRK